MSTTKVRAAAIVQIARDTDKSPAEVLEIVEPTFHLDATQKIALAYQLHNAPTPPTAAEIAAAAEAQVAAAAQAAADQCQHDASALAAFDLYERSTPFTRAHLRGAVGDAVHARGRHLAELAKKEGTP